MSAPTMNKKKKAGIREKVGTALSWLLSLGHDKPPHNIKGIDHEPPTLPQDTDKPASLVAHVESPREDGNPLMETTSSLRERGGNDSSGSAERTTFQDPLDLLKQSTTNSTSSSAFDDSVMDNSGIFSFLNDVIAGKHTELLKEMCHSSSSTEKGKEESAEEAAPHRSLKNSEEPRNGEVVVAEAASLEPRQEKKGEGGGKVMKKQKRLTVKALKAGGTSSAARLLKEYELIAYLGTGSFAEVTLARHKVTKKLYALKKISKRKVRKERCVKHTFTERQLLASLAHPFLVKLHQAFQSRTHLYLVLDFASGGDMYFFLKSKPWLCEIQRKLQRTRKVSWHDDVSYFYLTGAQGESDIVSSHLRTSSKSFQSSDALSNTISSSRSLAPNESRTPIRLVAFYAIEIALVLQFLHDNGFVYRDLKPENVLITREGNVVLTDFGVAKYRGASNVTKQVDERSDSFAGTTQYMSPEMLLGEPHDSRIDWWSFGCILFEMATGRRPFEGESQYDVVKSIVERDVCVYPEDFLLTPLEIELRVLQLHRRYHRFVLRLMRQICQGIKNENESEEEATPRPSNACIETHSAFPTVMLPISKCTPVPETRPECGGENSMPGLQSDVFNVSSNDIRKVKAPMTSEEHALYVEYVKEEMNEACEHLKDLILSLLNRRVDQRLCGKSVLEHPFFSCGYVCSQLYYNFYPRSEQIINNNNNDNNNNNNNSFCTPTTRNSSIVMSSQRATSPSNELLHSSLPRGESAFVSSGHCLGDNSVIDYSPRKQNENEMRDEESGDNMSSGNVQRTLNVTHFLSLPPTQRPENWRELFLERKVPPLYVPRLLAPDDLRYFPSAVTAMGESVVTQQRVLHEHTQRKTVSSRPHDVNEAEKGVPSSRTMPRKENPLPEDTQTSEEDENIELMEPSSNLRRRDSWVPGEEKKRMDISFEGSSHLGDTTGSFQSRLRDFFPDSSPQSFETSLVQTPPMKLKPRGKLCANEFCEDEETGTEHHDGSPQQLKLTRLDTSSSLCGTETTLTTSATTISKGIVSTEKSHALNTITLSPERREQPGFVLNSEADLTNREEGSIPDVSLPTDTLLKSTLRSESMSSVHRDVSSSATSIVPSSDDDYNRLVKTEDDKLDKQVATLQGIAYDVDDYLPAASKCRNRLLRNKTGIITLESSVSTDSKVDMRQIGNQKSDPLAPLWTQETLAAGEAPSNDNRQFPTYIPIAIQASETSVPIFATTTTSTTIANTGYENRESGGDPTHRQTSIFSTLSPDLITSAASPRSPRGASPGSSASLTPELHRLPMLFRSTEMPSLGDIVEDHPNSPTLGSSSFLGGGGGGMQHYLGFTFDARGGNTFLLGNSSGGANNEKWGF